VLKFSKSGYKEEKESKIFKNGERYVKNRNLKPKQVEPPDTTPPVFELEAVKSPVKEKYQYLSGTKEKDTGVWINEKEEIALGKETSWKYRVILSKERNSYVIFVKDKAGNKSIEKKVEIILDQSAPQGKIIINAEAGHTLSRWVELELSSEDNMTKMEEKGLMKFSNDGCRWLGEEKYKKIKKWELSEGDGEKRVYVKYGDEAGNWSGGISAKIILDTSLSGMKILSPVEGSVVSGARE